MDVELESEWFAVEYKWQYYIIQIVVSKTRKWNLEVMLTNGKVE